MKSQPAIYLLSTFLDDPRYVGFNAKYALWFSWYHRHGHRKWRVKRMKPQWTTPRVFGPVRKFNDYPRLSWFSVFSDRAVEALRDFLKPNGELLPLKSSLGNYFAYNITTIAEALNWRRSKTDLGTIRRHEFHATKVKRLSIFRIPEQPTEVYVTEAFVTRAREHGLRGMHFQKVWPLPRGADWRRLAADEAKKEAAKGLAPKKAVKGNSVIIVLSPAEPRSNGNKAEKKMVHRMAAEIDALLVDTNSDAPAVGFLEGHKFEERGKCRIYLSCPDADALAKKLGSWRKKVKWPGSVRIMKHDGHFADVRADGSGFYD